MPERTELVEWIQFLEAAAVSMGSRPSSRAQIYWHKNIPFPGLS